MWTDRSNEVEDSLSAIYASHNTARETLAGSNHKWNEYNVCNNISKVNLLSAIPLIGTKGQSKRVDGIFNFSTTNTFYIYSTVPQITENFGTPK